MMRMLLTYLVIPLLCFYACSALASPLVASDSDSSIQAFVGRLLEERDQLEDVRFAEVVEAVSGKKVVPVDASHEADAEMLAAIQEVIEAMLQDLARPEHPVHQVGRINETSRHVEEYLHNHLNRPDFLECRIPLNASGNIQRSGYPDLHLTHLPTGRIFYLDPKVYHEKSENSSFRTFYFEPKGETNKILDEASHLILGISHAGKVDGLWQFEGWKLVDLVDFRVRLKAEFQASNRDLYREEAVLLRSREP